MTVLVGGKTGFVTLASRNEVQFQVPTDAPLGATTVVVTNPAGSSAPFNVTLASHSPGLPAIGSGQNPIGTFLRLNGSAVNAASPIVPGEGMVITAYGLGPTTPSVTTGPTPSGVFPTIIKPTVTIGTEDAPVTATNLAPTRPGSYTIQIQAPAPVPEGNQLLTVKMAGFTSNTVTLPVGKAMPIVSRFVNGASFGDSGTATPATFATLYGVNFGSKDVLSGFPATTMEGASVTFNGISAPLVSVIGSQGQINVLVPSELPESGSVAVQVRNSAGAGTPFAVRMADAQPGIFRIVDPATPSRRAAIAVIANMVWLTIPDSMSRARGIPINCAANGINPASFCGQPAAVGDVIQIYMTGLRKATPGGEPSGRVLATGEAAPANANPLYLSVVAPEVNIDDIPAGILFSGLAPGFAELFQVNVEVPRGARSGDDRLLKVALANGAFDQATMALR